MRNIPRHIFFGTAIIAVVWPLAWSGWEPWSNYTFFPLWFGYILVVDGLTLARSGTSPMSRSVGRFIGLFLLSAPCWWLFEVANERLQNWHYVTSEPVARWENALTSTIAFSTVLPAIFVTAEFFRTLPALRRSVGIVRLELGRVGLIGFIVVGVLMMVAAMVVPDVAFPLVWIGAFFVLDPLNRLIGARSLAADVGRNNWSNVLALFAAGLTCGFFWEMWNIRAMPKWTYSIPHLDMPKLFEMPLIGYGGYFPFALELFAFTQFATWLWLRRPDLYVLPDPSPEPRTVRPRWDRWTAEIDGSYNRSGGEHAD